MLALLCNAPSGTNGLLAVTVCAAHPGCRYICALANSADVARLPYFLIFVGALDAKQIYDAPCGLDQMDEQMYKEEESL